MNRVALANLSGVTELSGREVKATTGGGGGVLTLRRLALARWQPLCKVRVGPLVLTRLCPVNIPITH